MARRRRLEATAPEPAEDAPKGFARETTSTGFARETRGLPPISQVAGDIAGQAALAELSQALSAARDEGRLIVKLPLEAVAADHLVRDRMTLDEAEMAVLEDSLRRRGQQVPIEVVDLGQGGYGLISGWRRVEALRRIGAGAALALVRRPEGAAEAYLAMIEENEVRAGLSFYERARLAVEAVRLGIHADPQAAIAALFRSAPAPKRSKIASFVLLHEALGAALRFPTAIPEHLGLALAGALKADPALAPRWVEALRQAAPDSAAAERTVLERLLKRPGRPGGAAKAAGAPARRRGGAGPASERGQGADHAERRRGHRGARPRPERLDRGARVGVSHAKRSLRVSHAKHGPRPVEYPAKTTGCQELS